MSEFLKTPRSRFMALGLAGALVLSACSGNDGSKESSKASNSTVTTAPEASSSVPISDPEQDPDRLSGSFRSLHCDKETEVYEVKSGDVLYKIVAASQDPKLNNLLKARVTKIGEINVQKGLIKSPDSLRPGQKIELLQNCELEIPLENNVNRVERQNPSEVVFVNITTGKPVPEVANWQNFEQKPETPPSTVAPTTSIAPSTTTTLG